MHQDAAKLDLDVATEFLLIAATLVELKAKRLLPGDDDIDLDEELALWEERDLLLARLLECKTFKDAAVALNVLAQDASLAFPRTAGLEDIEERIVVERALTPVDIHERYKVLNGAIYGLASHGAFTGAFKPGNRSRSVRGLYLAGGAAHPGPGMPMVMMSGWIAADAHDSDVRGVARRSA